MKFRPLHDRVVVKRIDAEEKTSGGIIIPDTVKEKPSQGEVVAVGPPPCRLSNLAGTPLGACEMRPARVKRGGVC